MLRQRVEEFWNISRIWRGQQQNKEGLNTGTILERLSILQYNPGTVALRADELSNLVVKGRRKTSKGKRKGATVTQIHETVQTRQSKRA